MAATNTVTSQSAAIDLVPLVIKDELLVIADKDTVFYELGQKSRIPEGEGRTVQWSRYERLPLPSAPLDEATTPTATALTLSAVTAVADQWGGLVQMSDVVLLTIKHPLLRIAVDRLGLQQAELLDREIQKALMGTSNVVFGGGKTSRTNLAAGDVFGGDLIRQTVANLRSTGAPSYMGMKASAPKESSGVRRYAGVVDPFVSMDIQKSPDFSTAAAYSQLVVLLNAEIGMWLGVRWKESNLLPTVSRFTFAAGINTAIPLTGAAVASGETGFASGTTVLVVVTQLDAVTGFETLISAQQSVTTNAAFDVSITLGTGDPTAVYGLYVSLENGSVATLQLYFNHVAGNSDAIVFCKAGVPNGTNHYVAQATGPVAPPVTPATGNVHISYICGSGAFGVTELGRLQTYITPATADKADPLGQFRTAGWKQLFKPVILNTSFFYRIETTSNFN